MRQIKYILIDSDTQNNNRKSGYHGKSDIRHQPSNIFSYHYVVDSEGVVLHPIDINQPGSFMPKPPRGQEDPNQCAIGIKYNGTLKRETCDLGLRALLISLLLDLRDRFPDAKILGLSEYDRYHIKVSDDMNQLRRELSDYL